jgi:hypothetical protein
LNKQEKNYLQMSFIRKEQADLLEWNNLNRNESDLKEILYLKSLKKFAINSLHDKYLCPEFPVASSESISPHHHRHHHHNYTNNEKLPLSTTVYTSNQFLNSIQYEICEKLCTYYEKMEAEPKFSQILNVETKFAELLTSISHVEHGGGGIGKVNIAAAATAATTTLHSSYLSQHHHGHLFFRIGLFGKALKFASLHNKYFMYKHRTYEMLSNIQQLMLNKLSHANWSCCDLGGSHHHLNHLGGHDEDDSVKLINTVALLHHNQEPDLKIKECVDKCFLQVSVVFFNHTYHLNLKIVL